LKIITFHSQIKYFLSQIIKKANLFIPKRKPPLILVYSLGKVGSSTLYYTLKKYFPKENVKHVHFLSDYALNEMLPKTNHTRHIKPGFEIREMVKAFKKENRPVKIITLVRDPFAREISNFFQNLVDFVPGSLDEYTKKELFAHFNEKVNFNYQLEWFDKEFIRYTGINIYTYPFNHKKGYTIIKKSGFHILAFKLESLNFTYSHALKKFLGKKINQLEVSNKSSQKVGVPPVLKYFKTKFRLNDEYINRVYDSKYVRHFYTEEEIMLFKKRWSENDISQLVSDKDLNRS